MTATIAQRRDLLLEQAAAAGTVAELFRGAAEHLSRLVPYDTALWMATDPSTGLPTAPTRVENIPHDPAVCIGYWQREFLTEDVNLFRDLVRAQTPVGGLRAATGDRPARSARFREFLHPKGIEDELRIVLRVNGSPWAYVSLFRERPRPAFHANESALAESISAPLAATIRDHAQAPAPVPGRNPHEPGLMLFAPDGALISVNDAALGWLDEVTAEAVAPAPGLGATGEFASPSGVRLPTVVVAALMRARAISEQREHGVARARLRSAATGQWLVCHASCLRDPSGEFGNTALVIEPAKASEIAPIIIQAYQLTPREQQIARLLARGFGTAEITGQLCLSAHTVRDYLKTIFDKVGVSSRGQLVAKLFAEHYAPVHLDSESVEVVGE